MNEYRREYRGADLARLIAGGVGGAPTWRWLEHEYGVTKVPGTPRRVVTLGPDEHELLMHLGIVPVLVNDSWGGQPNGVWPWARHLLGDARPATFSSETPPFDRLRALQPDLIVATWVKLDTATYAELSTIAPTIPNLCPGDPWGQAWDEHFRHLAGTVGMGVAADALIDDVRLRMMTIAEAHPHWQQLVAASVTMPDDVVMVDVEHQRGALLAALGFQLPNDLIACEGRVGDGELSVVDRDLLVWVNGNDDPSLIVDLPDRTRLAAHREGREIYLDPLYTAAFSVQSPLSLHFLLDMLVPEIEHAVDGLTTPPVPSSMKYGIAPAAG